MLSPKIKKQYTDLYYSIYPKKITATLIKDDKELYPFLKRNRLDHYFTLTYNKKSPKVKEYEKYKDSISTSLRMVGEKLKGEQYIVIKTFSSYPHVTTDLDLVIKKSKTSGNYTNLSLPIAYDISSSISWTDSPEISAHFIWKNTQKYSFNGNQFLVPNPALDVLIRMGHLPFEQGEMRLGELLHIYSQFSKINWNILESEAEKNGWGKTFRKTRGLLETLHTKLFETSEFVQFPYRLSYMSLAQAVIEKKAWKKIWGARYVIKDRLRI